MTATIGVLGCYGSVGRAVAARLGTQEALSLRLGGRDLTRVEEVASALTGKAVRVDIDDARRLAEFCGGCDVVVNCAGPSARILDAVAQAAHAAGAHYVDVAGDLIERACLPAGNVTVLGAGMMPGLSALLPRHLAAGADRPSRLVAHVGGLDVFTSAAAHDYVASLSGDYATPLAAWRGHQPIRGALRPAQRVRLPHIPGTVSAYPYLTRETERLARSLGLAEVEWWGVFDGDHTIEALSQGAALEAEELARASRLDALGRRPYFQLVFDLDGRTLVTRAADSYELTAAVAAAAALAVARGQIPPGVHEAGEALDPKQVLDDPALDVSEAAAVEEGVL